MCISKAWADSSYSRHIFSRLNGNNFLEIWHLMGISNREGYSSPKSEIKLREDMFKNHLKYGFKHKAKKATPQNTENLDNNADTKRDLHKYDLHGK